MLLMVFLHIYDKYLTENMSYLEKVHFKKCKETWKEAEYSINNLCMKLWNLNTVENDLHCITDTT